MRLSDMCAIAKENAYKDETLFYAMNYAMEKRNIGQNNSVSIWY